MDVFKAKGDGRGKNHGEDEPFKVRALGEPQACHSYFEPLLIKCCGAEGLTAFDSAKEKAFGYPDKYC